MALEAFIIGAVIAEAREIHRIEGLIEPVLDMFSAIFFVSKQAVRVSVGYPGLPSAFR